MKKLSFFILAPFLFLILLPACGGKNKENKQETVAEKEVATEITTLPPYNRFLASGNYSTAHFGPAQTNTFTNHVKTDSYQVYAKQLRDILPVMLSSMALNATTDEEYWVSGINEVYYISTANSRLTPLARLALATEMNEEQQKNAITAFADKSYTTGDSLKNAAKILFGKLSDQPIPDNRFSLVDNNNILYACNNKKLLAIQLIDQTAPAKGIKIAKQLDLNSILPKDDQLVGMQLTYDGFLILNSQMGHFCIVDRTDLSIKNQLQIIPVQQFFASVAVDDKNGVYAVSDSLMIKMVWNGTNLSLLETEGAWNYPIEYDRDSMLIEQGGGHLGAPVLMGFGKDPDKLVVIADGAKRANLIAFWRDEIPTDSASRGNTRDRMAGKIPISCGKQISAENKYIQSFHSIPIWGYGALFVNTINNYPTPITPIEYALQGSIVPCPTGIERFEWDYINDQWVSIWADPSIATSGMQPIISTHAALVLLNAFDSTNAVEGWTIKGYDWKTGVYKNKVVFAANTQYGNGGYGYFQFLKDGDLIFNSLCGVYRLTLGEDRGINKAPRL